MHKGTLQFGISKAMCKLSFVQSFNVWNMKITKPSIQFSMILEKSIVDHSKPKNLQGLLFACIKCATYVSKCRHLTSFYCCDALHLPKLLFNIDILVEFLLPYINYVQQWFHQDVSMHTYNIFSSYSLSHPHCCLLFHWPIVSACMNQ